jgi:hypothetical protein
VILIGLPLYVICFFSLTPFNILSLVSELAVLMMIYHVVLLFWSGLFGVLEASCMCMGLSFSRFGKFSVIILLNVLCIPFAFTSSVSRCPWFSSLVFWWIRWVLAFSFHRSWVV